MIGVSPFFETLYEYQLEGKTGASSLDFFEFESRTNLNSGDIRVMLNLPRNITKKNKYISQAEQNKEWEAANFFSIVII